MFILAYNLNVEAMNMCGKIKLEPHKNGKHFNFNPAMVKTSEWDFRLCILNLACKNNLSYDIFLQKCYHTPRGVSLTRGGH